ncbi:hypothetical protein [Bradyrhizobium sp. LA6.12]
MVSKLQRKNGEDHTGFTIRLIKAEVIERELEALAENFEGTGPDAFWSGQEVAAAIRKRIENHPDLQ